MLSVQSRSHANARQITERYRGKYPNSEIKSLAGFLDIQCCYPFLAEGETLSYTHPFSDDYPFPNYELLDSFPLLRHNWSRGDWPYPLMSSQGCPFACSYCASRKRKWLARSAANCVAELEQAKRRWKIKRFVVLDDCFNVRQKRVFEFCRLVKSLKLGWSCLNGLRADRFEPGMAAALAESGCERLNFGIESIDDAVLTTVSKGESFANIEEAILLAQEHFPPDKITGFFIIGLPGSSFETDMASLEWARQQKIHAVFSYYLPFDREMQYDSLFFGEGARPVSDAYPHEQQRQVYHKAHRIWGTTLGTRLKRLLGAALFSRQPRETK